MSMSIHRNTPTQSNVIDFIAQENKKFKPQVEALNATNTSPSTVVKLHQTKDKNLTYENIKQESITTWGNLPLDTISLQLSQNLTANTAPDRLNGLGEAALNYFESGKDNYNQSLINFSTPRAIKGNPDTHATYTKLVQDRLEGAPTDQVTLSLQTKSGTKVDLQINSLVNEKVNYDKDNWVIANGLSIDIKASAELSQEERDALVKLASGLENAIQGLNLEKPQTDIAGLLQFDPDVFESIDLKAKFNDPANSPFVFEFKADKNQRHLNVELAKNLQKDKVGGKFEIDVDLKNPELMAGEAQKKKSMDNYLKQVDQAAKRGNNKEDVIDIFKQSFASAHQLYPKAQFAEVKTDKKPTDTLITATKLSEKLADQDLAALSGMADFKVKLNIEGKTNPMRIAEVEFLNYQMSQETRIIGKENRQISQLQKTDLSARFHTQIDSDKPVQLTDKKASQNYDLYQIQDHAESLVTLKYDKDRIIKANIEKSADQSTHFERYLLGKQTKDKKTNHNQTASNDLLPLIKSLIKDQASTGSIYRQQILLQLNKNIGLETNPDRLKKERELEPNLIFSSI
ncbi:hypothetical protein [Janthinobacterium sp. B9-8]|uniref:hypothetical protein n=1 Tax=Janthinobacterium sp. B9-8 TaxID=1236179 RepID=UPI00061D161D|nr:hypothetical protein [Janthinobacterium sp. B9-8]AMC35185.1 hypothetical protein VN23_11460 [Janthinobacterium sp. B9-8]